MDGYMLLLDTFVFVYARVNFVSTIEIIVPKGK